MSTVKMFTIILLIVRISGEGYLFIDDLTSQEGVFWLNVHNKTDGIICAKQPAPWFADYNVTKGIDCNSAVAIQLAAEDAAKEARINAVIIVSAAVFIITFSLVELYAVVTEQFFLLVVGYIVEILHIPCDIVVALYYSTKDISLIAKIIDISVMSFITLLLVILLAIITVKIKSSKHSHTKPIYRGNDFE